MAGSKDQLSYFQGPTQPELVDVTLSKLLRDAVSAFKDRDAIIFSEQNVRMSYAELDQAVDQLAAGLISLQLKKGDRIGIWSPNRYEWVLTQFAATRIGLVLVNINPAYRLSELEYSLNKVGCKSLISAKSFKTSDYMGMMHKLAPELNTCAPGKLQSEKLPELKSVVFMDDDPGPGAYSFDQLMQLGGSDQLLRIPEIEKTLDPDEIINIQFTSGTTGLPKGASLSHFNIVNNARFTVDCLMFTENDRLAIPVPLYHCFGMVMGVLGCTSTGSAMIFPGEAFDAKLTLDAIAEERCTAVYGVPTMFVAMLQDLEKTPRDVTSLRTGIMAGAPCPVEIMQRVNTELHMEAVTICYGMTETSPVSFQSYVDDPIDKRCTTIGRVHPHLEVKIVDQEGQVVPIGTRGELCTRGYAVMKGYWEDQTRTDESIINGWMHSGDLGVFDDEGFCSIVGRVKDMIIRGGENIYPREIEEFLIRHPDVSDVQVFGIPDDRYGEVVCAWVIAKPDVQLDDAQLKDFCQDQIAHFKVPTHISFVDEFPLTISGKPQKFIMREKMVEFLAETSSS